MGSLVAALASYLDAHSNQGTWLLRIDDIDPPREAPGATDSILQSLQQHGLQWDENIVFQSHQDAAYEAALEQLKNLSTGAFLFACVCSRADMGPAGVCSGQCRSANNYGDGPFALRITVPEQHEIHCDDALQGHQCWPLGSTDRDFVLKRKDGLWAYQLAAAVDDTSHGITHVVRGSDLLDSTARQLYLQGLLGRAHPTYCHLPVMVDNGGKKFSKQNHAPALDDSKAAENLRSALQFLGQASPPASLQTVGELLTFATEAWALTAIPAQMTRPAAEVGLDS